jgi:hypothetical protein
MPVAERNFNDVTGTEMKMDDWGVEMKGVMFGSCECCDKNRFAMSQESKAWDGMNP